MYDINDYKEKTELTSQKLFTLMYSGLRSYRDIKIIQANKKGLEEVIQASASIFKIQSLSKFAHGVLEQLTSLLYSGHNAIYATAKDQASAKGLAAQPGESGVLEIIAATGDFEPFVGQEADQVLDKEVIDALRQALERKTDVQIGNNYTGYFRSKTGVEKVLYIESIKSVSEMDRKLIEVFCKNVSIAFDNINLKQEIEDTQRDIVYRLGEAMETRSRETGNHVKRVAEYSHVIAEAYGFRNEEVELIKLASPLHDVGKIGIPDSVLNKPGKLEPDEWDVMKNHSQIGYEMLKSSNRRILRAGAIIANEHHEKWDGSGYPRGLKGENIHIYGRITAVADVFDALGSWRCYKEPWELDRILDYFREQRGAHFEPKLADILLDRLYSFLEIKEKHDDNRMAK
jgi:response regulator RpfG family c-di-GMP phosphodiesterase